MALQESGPISFAQIQNEFGAAPSKNIGAYALQENYGNLNLSLDDGIPPSTSEGIKFSDFYGKRQRIVVDFYSDESASNPFRKNAKTRYGASNGAYVVGRTVLTTSLPSSTSGKRVIIHVNKQFGSEKGDRNYVALKTGTWNSDTDVQVIIGPSGGIYGAGGDGGAGSGYGNSQYFPTNDQSTTLQNITPGQDGRQGTSALGIQYPTRIINQGTIKAGRGGGGGGGAGYGQDYHDISPCSNGRRSPVIGGAGGAGGSGLPAGNGGPASSYLSRLNNKQGGSTTYPKNGTNGSLTVDGSGGERGNAVPSDYSNCGTRIAYGGSGGGVESSGGSGDTGYIGPGSGGQRGYAIIIDSTGSLVDSVSGNIPDGTTVNGTVL
jgi:hypothetical protein